MFGNRGGYVSRIGTYDYGNGRKGTHPIRRRTYPGRPKFVRDMTTLVEPVVSEANEIVDDVRVPGFLAGLDCE